MSCFKVAPLWIAIGMMLMGAASVRAAVPIGYWSFDGCTTSDGSGHGKDLTANNSTTCVSGRWGDAWSFDGETGYLDRAYDPDFTPGARPWSVTAWAKTDSLRANQSIVSWYRCGANPGCSDPDAALYSLGIWGGHPVWEVRDDGASGVDVADSTMNVADGGWHFIAGTMDPTTGAVRLYVDGALRLESQIVLGTLTDGGVAIPLEVGRWYRTGWGQPAYYFPGAIDEVRIYAAALSEADIVSLYTQNTETSVQRASWGRIKSLFRSGP